MLKIEGLVYVGTQDVKPCFDIMIGFVDNQLGLLFKRAMKSSKQTAEVRLIPKSLYEQETVGALYTSPIRHQDALRLVKQDAGLVSAYLGTKNIAQKSWGQESKDMFLSLVPVFFSLYYFVSTRKQNITAQGSLQDKIILSLFLLRYSQFVPNHAFCLLYHPVECYINRQLA